MGKRVLKVRNALTGKVREVALPGKPAVEKPARKKKAAPKKTAAKDVKVELKADVDGFNDAVKKTKGESDGQGNG